MRFSPPVARIPALPGGSVRAAREKGFDIVGVNLDNTVQQFEKYVTRLAPGDTVLLRSDDEEWRDANLIFEGEGEPGRPIVLTTKF